MSFNFSKTFSALTGHSPLPWQEALFSRFLAGEIPAACDIPTGLGKTSVIAIWLAARAAGAQLPRRLVYVVNRRTVVDQTSTEVSRLRENLEAAGIHDGLAISTLRGQMADNRAWSADPSQPAVICGTVDMVGSRLLFGGYRIGFKTRPLHAGFLGQDALLVHDEAHLEPAFQALIERIEEEQRRCGDPWPLRTMALTATSRSGSDGFQLGPEDARHPVVSKRLGARKALSLHPIEEKSLVPAAVEQALSWRNSTDNVVLFFNSVEAVHQAIAGLQKAGVPVVALTGTMRGFERERLVAADPVFRRFLPGTEESARTHDGPAFLICTSAGEVGVNLSADHLISDLSTFDSMAQRFGRLNRFGARTDSEAHVFHPPSSALDPEDKLEAARLATLTLLEALKGDASPAALSRLDREKRVAAFAPRPDLLPTTDVLFDAWAMTSIPAPMPGRPPLADYLHGVSRWEPPTTQVAWRDEVGLLAGKDLGRGGAEELLEDYPLKPHEVLTDTTSRIINTLAELAASEELKSTPLWIVKETGAVETDWTLERIARGDRKELERELADATIILPPDRIRPVMGFLTSAGAEGDATGPGDVADEWLGDGGRRLRVRLFDDATPPAEMRLIRRIVLRSEEEADADEEEAAQESGARLWSWYELPGTADTEGSLTARKAVLLDVHLSDVEREAERIVSRLSLPPSLKKAVVVAARLHDLGKRRRVWQRGIGNFDSTRTLAKAGPGARVGPVSNFRHELASIIDAREEPLLAELDDEARDLALHLIAAHHGRARPHFPKEELFDPERRSVDMGALGTEVINRFGRLQKRYGRWGLAYLESLVRAADYAASARLPQTQEEMP
ncbi:MAG: type I-U CRISPR-associated helicase/endonuclease Cas3 [Myxococcaceae bacterium]|nr:type I-U CRISPR-associated helicase/endonuclease Cas3 [Myxococcaceae bacterium]